MATKHSTFLQNYNENIKIKTLKSFLFLAIFSKVKVDSEKNTKSLKRKQLVKDESDGDLGPIPSHSYDLGQKNLYNLEKKLLPWFRIIIK